MMQLTHLMQLGGAVADLMDIQGSSVLVCLENGWDATAQVREGWRERGLEGERVGGREGWRKRGLEGERVGGRESWRERGLEGVWEGWREGVWEGWKECGRVGGREGRGLEEGRGGLERGGRREGNEGR